MSKNSTISVRVFGVPTTSGCDCGTNSSTWREATEWVARSLKQGFGDKVRVEYFDLFLDAVDVFPQVMDLIARGEATPPLVFIGDDQGHLGELFSSGGKISGPAIRKRLEALEFATAT
jgi:disulfide oxidoreductase YuzD